MATGTLGQSNPAAATNTTVYTVPVGKVATYNVNIVNTGATVAVVRLAVAATGTPTTAEYMEYGTEIPANSVLERGGIVSSSNKNVVVYASNANVAVNVYGYEE